MNLRYPRDNEHSMSDKILVFPRPFGYLLTSFGIGDGSWGVDLVNYHYYDMYLNIILKSITFDIHS